MKSFKKAFGSVGKFFKKAGHDTNKFFKKGGQFQKGVGQVAGGLGSVSKVLRQGANIGNKVLGFVEKTPLGAVLAPEIQMAKQGLNYVKQGSNLAGQGKHILNDARHGDIKGVIRGVNEARNDLERAKPAVIESPIKFA